MTDLTIDSLQDDAVSGLIRLGVIGSNLLAKGQGNMTTNSQYNLRYASEAEQALSLPVLKYVHVRLWAEGKPMSRPRDGFMRITKGLSLASIVREIGSSLLSDQQLTTTTTQIGRVLQANSLLLTKQRGPNPIFHVAPWSNDLVWKTTAPKAAKKARKTAKTAKTTKTAPVKADNGSKANFDIRALGTPEARPEAFVRWAEEVVKLNDSLLAELNKTKDELAELHRKQEDATRQLSQLLK